MLDVLLGIPIVTLIVLDLNVKVTVISRCGVLLVSTSDLSSSSDSS